MALVDLGVKRNPGKMGNKGLLRIATGENNDFEMVKFEFYRKRLEKMRTLMEKDGGVFAWVIGERGTGKSEVLANLYKETFNDADSKKPRLPIYISVSKQGERLKVPGGVPSGEVTIRLMDWLCRNALKEAFEFLRNYDDNPELYRDLRELCSAGEMYDRIALEFEQEHFELEKFLEYWEEELIHGLPFRLTILIDDVDKITTPSAIRFYKDAQSDLSGLVDDHDIIIVSAVTKEFAIEGRQNEGLNYCLNSEEMKSDLSVLYVPELSDLSASDVEEFIDRRFRYLHWTGREKGFSWAANFRKEPHSSWNEVVEHQKWKSYDPRSMRNNGALLSLNAWLAARDRVNIRQVLRNLEAILNSHAKPKAELTARILEDLLKSNDRNEAKEFAKELSSRIAKEVSTERLDIEYVLLSEELERGADEVWYDLLGVALDRLALGVWPDRSTSGTKVRVDGVQRVEASRWHRIQRLTNNTFEDDSAVTQLLNLVVELNEDERLIPNFHSRTPDDVFSLFSAAELMRGIRNEHTKRRKEEFEEEILRDSNNWEAGAKRTAEHARKLNEGELIGVPRPFRGIVSDAYYEALIDEEWMVEGRPVVGWTETLEPEYALYLGQQIGMELSHYIIGSDWSKHHKKIKRNWEENPRDCRRLLMQWLWLRAESTAGADADVINAVHDVITGNNILALFSAAKSEMFAELVDRASRPLSELMIEFARSVMTEKETSQHYISEYVLESLEIDLAFNNKDVPLENVLKDLKITPKEKARISITHTGGALPSQLGVVDWIDCLDTELAKLHDGTMETLDKKIGNEVADRQLLALIRNSEISYEVVLELPWSISQFCIALLDSGRLRRESSRKINATLESKSYQSWNRDQSKFTMKGNLTREHDIIDKMEIRFRAKDPNQEKVALPYSIVLKNN